MKSPLSYLARAGLVAGLLAPAAFALAQSPLPGAGDLGPWAKPGRIFTGTKGVAGVVHLPRFKNPFLTTGANFSSGFRFTTNAKPVVFGSGRFMGYMFRDRDLPAWMGRRVRVSVGGRLWVSALRQSITPDAMPTDTRVSVASINGAFGSTGLFANRKPGQVNFKVDMSGYELSAQVTGERQLSRRMKLMHSLIIWGGRSRERYRIGTRLFGDNAGTPVTAAAYHLDETVRSTRIGSSIGIGLDLSPLTRSSC